MTTNDSTPQPQFDKLPKGFRIRPQKSGKTYYYYDTLTKPRVEMPLGNDYGAALEKYWAIVSGPKAYKIDAEGYYLYRHFDRIGILLYVGISLSAIVRLEKHRVGSLWFANVVRVEIEKFDTHAECKAAERLAIRTERPLFNYQHAEPARRIYVKKLRKAALVMPSDTSDVSNIGVNQ